MKKFRMISSSTDLHRSPLPSPNSLRFFLSTPLSEGSSGQPERSDPAGSRRRTLFMTWDDGQVAGIGEYRAASLWPVRGEKARRSVCELEAVRSASVMSEGRVDPMEGRIWLGTIGPPRFASRPGRGECRPGWSTSPAGHLETTWKSPPSA